MKRLLLLVLLCVTGIATTNAQTHPSDIIYLKNGAAVKGIIMKSSTDETIKIMERSGKVHVFSADDIDKVTRWNESYKRQVYPSRSITKDYSSIEPFSSFEKGYFCGVDVAVVGIGLDDWKGYYKIKASFVNGYKLNPYISVGGGIGVMGVLKEKFSEIVLPIFAHLHVNFLDNRISPYFSFNTGYNQNLSKGIFGGYFAESAIGMIVDGNFMLGIGYKVDKLRKNKLENYSDETIRGKSSLAQSINIKVGIRF